MRIKTLRAVIILFILIPFLTVSIAGLVVISSHTKQAIALENEEIAVAQAERVSKMVNELAYPLISAAENEFVKEAFTVTEMREAATRFLSAFVEAKSEVYDILLTDTDEDIFISCTEKDKTGLFFDENMTTIASSPTPVSGFYDSGRFYIAKPVTNEENKAVGYIILVTEPDLIEKMNLSITVSDDPNHNAALTGEIEGTKWKWGFDYPSSQASSKIFKLWIIPFAIAAVICTINIIIMLIITKKLGDS